MRIYHDQLVMRIGGTLCGLGFLLVGLFALFGGGDAVDPVARERAFGFGISALIAGCVAIPISWLVQRIDNIWCAPPRKGWFSTTSSTSLDKKITSND
jgi:hypothetical protein